MLLVIGRRTGFVVDDCPLHQLWQHRAKVFGDADCPYAMQVIQCPNDTCRALVEAGVTISHPVVTRVSRPERVGMEMGDRIGRNFFDRAPNSRLIPGVLCKRAMTSGGNHGVGLLSAVHPDFR